MHYDPTLECNSMHIMSKQDLPTSHPIARSLRAQLFWRVSESFGMALQL
jgi:hypothetical protein